MDTKEIITIFDLDFTKDEICEQITGFTEEEYLKEYDEHPPTREEYLKDLDYNQDDAYDDIMSLYQERDDEENEKKYFLKLNKERQQDHSKVLQSLLNSQHDIIDAPTTNIYKQWMEEDKKKKTG